MRVCPRARVSILWLVRHASRPKQLGQQYENHDHMAPPSCCLVNSLRHNEQQRVCVIRGPLLFFVCVLGTASAQSPESETFETFLPSCCSRGLPRSNISVFPFLPLTEGAAKMNIPEQTRLPLSLTSSASAVKRRREDCRAI